MPPVQLPQQLKTLDDLLAQTEHYAIHSMRKMGRVPPTLWLIGAHGQVMFILENPADDARRRISPRQHDSCASSTPRPRR
jgi:hypothetical protein